MPEVFGHLGWRHAQSRGRPFTGTVLIEETPALQSTLVSRLVYIIVAIYAITFATLSVLAHDSFNTHAFDLGNMDQAVWNTLHGRWFQFSNWEGGTTRLAAHVEPILIAIAQLYRIYSSPSTLLVFQAIVMSLGALPAFWLARDKLRSDFAGVVFASAYLLSPTLEAANLHDFHVVSLASSLLLFAFYFIHRRRYGLFLVFAILAMATKEQVPISVALMGLYVALVQKRRLLGGFTTTLAVAWFIVAFFIVIPHFNPAGASPYIGRYDQIGSSPKEIVANLFSHPGTALANLTQPAKASYLMRVFAPVAFLSVFSITVVFVLPDLLLSLLSDFPAMYGFQAHYGAVMAPFVIISGIYGAAFLLRWCRRLFPKGGPVLLHGLSLLVLIFSLYGYYRVVFLPMSDHVPVVTDHDRLAKSFIKTLPDDAAVSALSVLNPHVSQRQRLYLFPDVRDAEYIFLDVTSTPAPIDTPSLEWRVRMMLQDKNRGWGVLAAKDGYMLLKRGEANASIPPEFY
ncbi:MAG: DUF2079 domain-containing protein, partial [Chloroflexi bacterium]|nr:DUF2079 domain-containing protein [Chloroflexota bacterium]